MASLEGSVVAAGKPLAGASVTIYGGAARAATELGRTETSSTGQFRISYTRPDKGVIYVLASPTTSTTANPATSPLLLAAVVGVVGAAGGVAPHVVTSVTVNELTTVATSVALAQFVDGTDISGPSPGLENAAATTFNLADPSTGGAGGVVTDEDNGTHNDSLATLYTLADLVAVCSQAPEGARCHQVLRLATPPGAGTPTNTVQAIQDLVKNPTTSRAPLFALAKTAATFSPSLTAPPRAWMIALLYTDTDLYSSGRVAIDAKGDVWSNNNWAPGTTNPSTVITVLNPVGSPILGSPISGGGVKGGGWGTAIAQGGSAWFTNVAKGAFSIAEFSSDGRPVSPGTGFTNGALDFPQGVAVDQKGNIWIANNYGPESAPGQGDVVVYPGGNPAKAITITGGGLNHPFAIQIDGRGNAWVSNEGLGGAQLVGTKLAPLIGKFSGSVTVIGPNFKPTAYSPIQSSSFRFPLGIALDSEDNAWVVSYFNNTVIEIRQGGTIAGSFKLPGPFFPWADAVDGSDRVWVSGFSKPGVWLLCGANTAACPPGSSTGTLLSPPLGFASAAMQHITSIQIDPSGNVWLSNNWSKILVGGVGIVELVGVATPVCTPLIGLPANPMGAGGCQR